MPQLTKVAAVEAALTQQPLPALLEVMERSLEEEEAVVVPLTMVLFPELAATAALALSVFGAGNDELRNPQCSRSVHQSRALGR